MPAEIIDINRKRAERMLRRQPFDEAAFDREMTRRLARFLEGDDLPGEPIWSDPQRR